VALPVTGITISGRVCRRQSVPVFNGHRSRLSVSKLELGLFFGVIVSVSYARLGFPSFGFGADSAKFADVPLRMLALRNLAKHVH
jgi:hypothetical protein